MAGALVSVEFLEIISNENGVLFTEWCEKISIGNVKAIVAEYRKLDEAYAKANHCTVTFHARIVKPYENQFPPASPTD